MSTESNIVLIKCRHCGGQPELHKKGNKFYYECSGDCWTATNRHSIEKEAAKEWNEINSREDGVELLPLKDLLKACLCCSSRQPTCGFCPLRGMYDCYYIRRDQLKRWMGKLSEG